MNKLFAGAQKIWVSRSCYLLRFCPPPGCYWSCIGEMIGLKTVPEKKDGENMTTMLPITLLMMMMP